MCVLILHQLFEISYTRSLQWGKIIIDFKLYKTDSYLTWNPGNVYKHSLLIMCVQYNVCKYNHQRFPYNHFNNTNIDQFTGNNNRLRNEHLTNHKFVFIIQLKPNDWYNLKLLNKFQCKISFWCMLHECKTNCVISIKLVKKVLDVQPRH